MNRYVRRWLRMTPKQRKAAKQELKRKAQKIHSWDFPCIKAKPHRNAHSNKMKWDVRLKHEYVSNTRVPQYHPVDIRNRKKITCKNCLATSAEAVLALDLDEMDHHMHAATMAFSQGSYDPSKSYENW